jgi:7,8-dihydropterin-6-yl-methyl-4-(beta-D-ribofuranosyl)aminobenzene 5'-phosphate synthase
MDSTLTILYDNEARDPPLTADWGFAALVCTEAGEKILFDSGASGTILLHNARVLGEDLSTVTSVVLSHWHWDHSGGLKEITGIAPGAKFFLPFRRDLTFEWPGSHPVRETPVRVAEGVYSTGVVGGIEQALVVISLRRTLLLTGCAHPGVPALLTATGKVAKPTSLLGGLHDFSDFDCLTNLCEVYPCHCTQHTEEILKRLPSKAFRCGVGLTMHV